MKKLSTALLSLLILGSAVMPAVAETGYTQTSSDINTNEGNGNNINQTTSQGINPLAWKPRPSDTVNAFSIPNEI